MTIMSMPDHLRAVASGGPPVAAAVVPLLVLVVAFDVYCLVDLVRARSARYLPKIVWALIILFISAPIGGLLYLFLGRDRGYGSGAPSH
jgi:Phospholipase_D-nuclease N-terminal